MNVPETRGFWKWLKRVARADAIGAISGGGLGAGSAVLHGTSWKDAGKVGSFGALFVGICASITEMIATISPKSDGYSIVINSLPEVFANADVSISDSIGYFHNLIIQEIYSEDKNIFSKDFSIIQQLILKHMGKYGFAPIPEIISALPFKMSLVQQCLDKSDREAVELLIAKYPEYKNEIAVLDKYMQNLSSLQSKNEVTEYTLGFRDVVTNSQIPQSSVSFVQSSVSVAANSAILWSTHD